MESAINQFWWLILLGAVVPILLIILVIASILINNRKLLRLQQEKLEEVKKSEKLYSDLFNNVSDLVYIHSFDGRIIKINSAVKKIFGYEPYEVEGKYFQHVFNIPQTEYNEYINSITNKEFSTGTIVLKTKERQSLIFEYQNSIFKESNIPVAIRGIARNVTEKIESELKLRRKDKLLSAVADSVITLLIHPDHNSAINIVLKILGETTQVDRVYIFENHIDPKTKELLMSQRFEWCKEGIEPQIDNPLLQNLPYSHPYAQSLFEKVRNGEIYTGIVRFMSEKEKEILEPQNIKSIIIIPIYIGSRFWGFIGFDDCTNERVWSEVDISILKAAAGSIGGLIGLMEIENELKKTNIFLQSILESSISIAIITVDLEGRVKYWNSGAENLLGYSSKEILDQSIVGKIIREDDFITREKLSNITKETLTQKSTSSVEIICYHKNGMQRWMNFTISPIIKENGEVEGFSAIGEDVTQRKITELALIQNEEMFRSVWENSIDGMRLVDENAKIRLVNKAFCELVNMTEEKLVGNDFNICFLDRDPQKVELFKEHIKNELIPTRQNTELTLWNGKKTPVEITNSFIYLSEGRKLLLSVFRDISEQIAAENKIRQSEENYRRLALHLQTIREEERAKIAQDIHDHLGQLLTGLHLDFSYLKKITPRDNIKINDTIDSITKLIQNIIESVQRISSELRPPILDDLGLIPAIEWELSKFRERTDIKCKFLSSISNVNVNKKQLINIFRIFQESLTNIARHSNASNVNVNVYQKNGCLYVIIKDDGKGIPIEKLNSPSALGLIGMRERALSCNGELIIDSKPGTGTKITLKIPTIGGENGKN